MSEQQEAPIPEAQRDFYTAIAHASEPRVLLLPGEAGWVLPHFQPRPTYWAEAERTNQAMKEQLGIDVTLLRTIHFQIDSEIEKRTRMLNLVENHSPTWTPPQGARWADNTDLANLALEHEWQREYLAAWLREDERGEIPHLRVPWARRGWLAWVQEWVGRELAERGIEQADRWEQVKHWGISSVWRIPTDSGDIYFKAVPPLFAAEPVITESLARRYPEHIPPPLALDKERSWMLMRDFAAPIMWDVNPIAEQYGEVLRLLARVQIDSVNIVQELLDEGCADRRLHMLDAEVDALLSDPLLSEQLSQEDAVRLRALGPSLKEMCERLASYAVPETLVHGDYHSGNIAVRGDSYLIYDWTDACVTHPFLDLASILENDKLAASYNALRDTYLMMWTAYEPLDRLREAYELSRLLSVLHQLVSYRNIIAGLEPAAKWEMQFAMGYWPRKLLEIAS